MQNISINQNTSSRFSTTFFFRRHATSIAVASFPPARAITTAMISLCTMVPGKLQFSFTVLLLFPHFFFHISSPRES
jgi:hypothetical protein